MNIQNIRGKTISKTTRQNWVKNRTMSGEINRLGIVENTRNGTYSSQRISELKVLYIL